MQLVVFFYHIVSNPQMSGFTQDSEIFPTKRESTCGHLPDEPDETDERSCIPPIKPNQVQNIRQLC